MGTVTFSGNLYGGHSRPPGYTRVQFGHNHAGSHTHAGQNGPMKRSGLKMIEWYRSEGVKNNWFTKNVYSRIIRCGFKKESCSHFGLNLFENPQVGFIRASVLTSLRILVCNPFTFLIPPLRNRLVPRFESTEAVLAWSNRISLRNWLKVIGRSLHIRA